MSERTDLKGLRRPRHRVRRAASAPPSPPAFADLGAGVVVNSALVRRRRRQLADELPDAIYVQADVSDPAQAEHLVDAAVERYGRLDIVVNNAGTTAVIPHDDLDAATTEIWETILRVNVIGPWNVVRAAAPHLRASGDGVILNITSLAGVRPVGSSIPYAVSKAALNHLTVLLANVLGPEIRVHAVAPGSSTRRGPTTGTTCAPTVRETGAAAAQRHPGRRRRRVRRTRLGAATRPGRSWSSTAGWRCDERTTRHAFDRDDPPILGANPFVGLTREQVAPRWRGSDSASPSNRASPPPRRSTPSASCCASPSGAATSPPPAVTVASPTRCGRNPLFRRLMQAYLVENDAAHRVIDEVELDTKSRARAHFAMSLLTEALAPTNILLTNPDAMAKAVQTRGQSLVAGVRNVAHDLRHNGGMPSQVDTRPFAVGSNLAVTPGHVVHRTEVFELIQYDETATKVHRRPLVVVPPQINKYYITDLAPGRSLVESTVAAGIPVLHARAGATRRPSSATGTSTPTSPPCLEAIHVACDIAGTDDANVVGLCAGGVTLAALLGHLAATGESSSSTRRRSSSPGSTRRPRPPSRALDVATSRRGGPGAVAAGRRPLRRRHGQGLRLAAPERPRVELLGQQLPAGPEPAGVRHPVLEQRHHTPPGRAALRLPRPVPDQRARRGHARGARHAGRPRQGELRQLRRRRLHRPHHPVGRRLPDDPAARAVTASSC